MSVISPSKRGRGCLAGNGLGIGHLSHKAAPAFSREPFSDSLKDDVLRKFGKWAGKDSLGRLVPHTDFHNYGSTVPSASAFNAFSKALAS